MNKGKIMSKCKCTECKCAPTDPKDFVAWAKSKNIELNPAQIMVYNHVMNEDRCIQYKCRRLGEFTFLYTVLSFWLATVYARSVFMVFPNHSCIKESKRLLYRLGLYEPDINLKFSTYESIEVGLHGHGRVDYVFCDEAGIDKELERTVRLLEERTRGSLDDTIVLYSSIENPYLTYLRRLSDRWDSKWTFFQVPAFLFKSEQADNLKQIKSSMGQQQYAMEMECKLDR